jgi:hypothetical protein
VNGFNAAEVEEMLNRGYEAMVLASRNAAEGLWFLLPRGGVGAWLMEKIGERPAVHKSERGWSTPKPAAWGVRANALANGASFLGVLKKGCTQVQQQGN